MTSSWSRTVAFGAALCLGAATQAATPDPSHWAYQPLGSHVPPTLPGKPIAHPIDAFIQARLVAAGLEPARESPARTQLRRLSYDLVGLPPRPEELDAFESACAA